MAPLDLLVGPAGTVAGPDPVALSRARRDRPAGLDVRERRLCYSSPCSSCGPRHCQQSIAGPYRTGSGVGGGRIGGWPREEALTYTRRSRSGSCRQNQSSCRTATRRPHSCRRTTPYVSMLAAANPGCYADEYPPCRRAIQPPSLAEDESRSFVAGR